MADAIDTPGTKPDSTPGIVDLLGSGLDVLGSGNPLAFSSLGGLSR